MSCDHFAEDSYRSVVTNENIELVQNPWMRADCRVISVVDALAQTWIVAIPEEVTRSATNSYGREYVFGVLIVDQDAKAIVAEELGAELAEAASAGHPPGGNDHAQVPRLQPHGLRNEEMVDRRVVRPTASASHLVRGIPDDHVELHIAPKEFGKSILDVVCVDKRVSVSLESFVTFEDCLTGTAELTPRLNPRVFQPFEPDVAQFPAERPRNRVLAIRVF
jgi:hypothetical protein